MLLEYIKFIKESEDKSTIERGSYVRGVSIHNGLNIVDKIARVEAIIGENYAIRFISPEFANGELSDFDGRLSINCGKIIPKRFVELFKDETNSEIKHDIEKLAQKINVGDVVLMEGLDKFNDDINYKTGVIYEILGGGKYRIKILESDNGQAGIEFGIYDKYQFMKNDRITENKNKGNYILTEVSEKALLYCNLLKTYSDISYFDITDKNDEISYLPINRIERIKSEKELWTSTMRQTTKIGKILTRILPEMPQSEIEKYVNKYKASYDNIFVSTNNLFKIVDGEEIRHWYLEENYTAGGGSLNNSCMRHREKQHVFNIYTENPDKVKMLILKNRANPRKIDGRALIWFLNNGRIFMDRVYTVDDHKMNMFFDYATKNDWYFFANFAFREHKNNPPGTMTVKLKRDYGNCGNNPYMDTMRYFHNRRCELSNNPPSGLDAVSTYNCF